MKLTIILLIICLSANAQKPDSPARKVPDSALFVADTTILKLNVKYMDVIEALLTGKDHSYNDHEAFKIYFYDQQRKQAVKKPVK